MTEQSEWKWWVGHDEERYHTECDTRDEAVRIASEEQDGGYIIEATQNGNIAVSQYFDGDYFLEHAEDRGFADFGDPEGDSCIFPTTPDQIKDLEKMVRSTIDAWQKKHGLTFNGWRFAASRNQEYIPEKDGHAAEGGK